MTTIQTKVCEHCGLTFEIKVTPNGHRQRFCNRKCQSRANAPQRRLRYINKPRPKSDPVMKNKRRKNHLSSKYSMTAEDYDIELHNQNHVCAICCQPETALYKGSIIHLAVDHSHETGRYRGLLCASCNRAVGMFKDNIAILKQAIQYLERHKDPRDNT